MPIYRQTVKQFTPGLLMIGDIWKRRQEAPSSNVAGIHGVWDHTWHYVNSELRGKDVDCILGEYYYFHLETTSTSPRSTSNKAMKMETRSRLRAGTLVYSSAWFCGISMTHRYTLCTVREKASVQSMSVLMCIVLPAANHRFNAEESDWGFTRFAEVRRLFAPQWDDKGRPMIENDAVNVTAYLRIYKDPTGVLWHNFIKLVLASNGEIFAETYEVTIRRKRPAWLASRTKGQPAISTHSFNPYISRTLFARYVVFLYAEKVSV